MEAKTILSIRAGLVPVLFLYFMFGDLFARETLPGDSSKKVQVYDLNDPRNPDCPCHKYQKIADEEYAALSKKKEYLEKGVSVFGHQKEMDQKAYLRNEKNTTEITPFKGQSSERKDHIKRKDPLSYFKYRKKKKDKSRNVLKRIFGINHISFWKRNPSLDSCFSWK